ncbi:MAG: discoidin domain-containing protein, partial [Phycisphaerales bacterium]
MCKLLRKRIRAFVFVCFIALNMTGPVLAIDHWWHGGVSANVNDPNNWTDRDAATDPTTPTGDPRDIVRIGGSWDSEDLNGNGLLDPGEDLNGNGVIDDPNPNFGVGYGGYHGSGGGIDLPVDPVLSSTYVSRTGGAEGGWWFVLNWPNILTLKDGAFLIMDEENCNLRNGGRLEVQGRSNMGGPSLITAGHFRMAEHGSIEEAAHETCQLRINGTGWMQVDASLDGGNSDWFRIGTSETPGTMPRGEVIIEDSGRLEVLPYEEGPYVLFGNSDPQVNQIIIRDNGELWLPGDQANMGRVGPDQAVTSLQDMIAMGLIANDQGGILTVSGTNPTVVKVSGVDNPSPTYANPDVAGEVILSWDPDPESSQARYNVYFGADLASVTDATRINPLGVLKSQDQTETNYPQTEALSLDFGQTYYWRVDTVTAPPDSTVIRGKLWCFTVEPFAQRLAPEAISTMASSSMPGQGSENTVNGSGLTDDLHGRDSQTMWLSAIGGPQPTWIQFEFDNVYQLHEMWVWNSNTELEMSVGFGAKDVTIEYSLDGIDYTTLGTTHEFARASGDDGYSHNTTIDFGGVQAKYVKLTVNTNWALFPFPQFGLSEVRFFHI